MAAFFFVSVAVGIACAVVRLRAGALVVATIVLSITFIIEGREIGLSAGIVTLTLFTGVALLQLFYLGGWFFIEYRNQPVLDRKLSPFEVARVLRSAIGQEMRMSCPLPVDLPPHLETRFAQLQARYG
jgi:hypothetical protein